MLVPDHKPSTIRTAEHYRQYRQQLARKGVTKKPHAISTENNIKGTKLRWKKYDVSMAYTFILVDLANQGSMLSVNTFDFE